MTDRKTDSNLDAYLSGNSQLSTAYRDGAEEIPPTHLDSAILLQAREQAERFRARKSSPWWSLQFLRGVPFGSNWALPVAVVSIVIVPSLVVLVEPALDVAAQTAPSSLQPRADITPRAPVTSPIGAEDVSRDSSVQASSLDQAVPSSAPASRVVEPLRDSVPSAPAIKAAPKGRTGDSSLQLKLDASQDPGRNPTTEDATTQTDSAASAGAAFNDLQETLPSSTRSAQDRQALEGLRKAERNRQKFEERRTRIARERARLGKVVRQEREQRASGTILEPASGASANSTFEQSTTATTDSAMRLERIRTLIADGEIRLARAVLDALLRDYPDFEVPSEISAAFSIQ